MGLERLNAGFLLHVLQEQSESNELNSSSIRGSMDRWWANCIRDEDERVCIGKLITKVRSNDEYIFTRDAYEKILDNRMKEGRLTEYDGP